MRFLAQNTLDVLSPEGTLTRYRALTATLWLNQGTVTAALRLIRGEGCGREEWTGEGKADSIKSQGTGDSTWSLRLLGTSRQGINTCWNAMISP